MKRLLAAAMLLTGSPALAQEAREFCADRPGLGTPACTLAPGKAMVELGLAAWDRSRDAASITDEVTLGDALLRVGLGETTELQIGLAGHVIQRQRDRASGAAERASGTGDGRIALRQGLSGANGPVAAYAFVDVPLGQPPIGAGAWSGGLIVPIEAELPAGFKLELAPEVDWAANGSGAGHHLAWGGVAGLSHRLGPQLTVTGEVAAFRDDDPAGHSTDARLAGSLAWQVADRLQIDFEADAGLSPGAPDRTLALGLAWQFR